VNVGWFDTRTVRRKFDVLIGVAALGVIGCAAAGFYGSSDLAATALAVQAWDFERLTIWARIDEKMLMCRRHEKDFQLRSLPNPDYYRTKKSSFLDSHVTRVAELKAAVTEAQQLYAKHEQSALVDFDEIQREIVSYDRAFHAHLDRCQKRGIFGCEVGAVGECRACETEIEAALAGKPDLLFAVGLCRRDEKEYYLTKDQKTAERFRREVAAFRTQAQGNVALGSLLERYEKSFDAVVALDAEIGLKEDLGLEGELRTAIHKLEPLIAKEIKAVDESRAATLSRIYDGRRRVSIIIGAIAGPAFLLVVFLCRSIAGRVSSGIESLRERVRRMASGELAVAFLPLAPGSEDDVERLEHDLGELASVLRTFIAASQAVSATLDNGIREVARALDELAQGYTEQSSAVTETVATLDQLRASSVAGSDRAKDVLEQARQTTDVADKGGNAVDAVIGGMGRIKTQTSAIATSVLDLSERAARIGEIVETVSGIADQSKLLALNASIEAAKAGEYGHGFAVVAEEVRALAERSQAATREIASILREIQKATNKAVLATEDGSKSVEQGLTLVATSKESIETLSATIGMNAKSVEQIAFSVNQQAAGVTQINQAMSGILSAVQQGTAESTRIKQAMVEVERRTTELASVVSRFRGAKNGERDAPAEARR
jgi:methyl-accepting chemotaxis protein